jgi:hypothetical protein
MGNTFGLGRWRASSELRACALKGELWLGSRKRACRRCHARTALADTFRGEAQRPEFILIPPIASGYTLGGQRNDDYIY